MGRAFRDRARAGCFDLEALETATREAMRRGGAIVLSRLLSHEDGRALGRACACGGRFGDHRRQGKTVRTLLGAVRHKRTRQRCGRCGTWRVPADEVLDTVGTGFSPGLRRAMARTGSMVPFARARELLADLAGVAVTDKDVERVAEAVGADVARRDEEAARGALDGETVDPVESPPTLYVAIDGTGVPVLRRETEGRTGKAPDGVARTREVKLGAVFTQAGTDAEGRPVRDPDSTTYVGGIVPAARFARPLYAEALRRGLEKAGRVAILGDGAAWIWNLADEHFPEAVQIVDLYHAREHLAEIARMLHPADDAARDAWRDPLAERLSEGDIDAVLAALAALRVRGKRKESVDRVAAYFARHRRRMRYADFRRAGFFVGSGVVEAGCRAVIGQRLKLSGMHWTVRGADAILALRCTVESGRFEDYWENRRAA